MATIKTTGTGSGLRVLTKTASGVQRVSCSCCAIGCCMYPAASAVAADLPDAITLLGVGSLAKSGTDYGDTNNGVILETGVWARYLAGVRSTSNCLILGDGNFTVGDNSVEDQFAASYTVNFNEPYPERGLPATQTFVRESLCVWKSTSGYDYGTGTIYYDVLTYGSGFGPYGSTEWEVFAVNMLATWLIKTGAQNSPIGTYSAAAAGVDPISVSL